VSSIPNLGPSSQEAFARAGITTAEEIVALGPDEAYRRLLQAGNAPHFIGYYVLVMGLQGRPWNDCKGKEKAALRARFDAIKTSVAAAPSETRSRARMDAALDEIGLVPRRGGAAGASG
jgi:hypothetical protein